MRTRPTSLVALVATLLLASGLNAQQPAAPAPAARPAVHKPAPSAAVVAVPGPSVEGISEFNLPNGLKVLLFPDQSKPTITVNITYLVGSRHEGYGETGMAHLLEHMLFKGSTRHPDVWHELDSHGANPNGTTWYDRTNYFETFAASDSNLVWSLDLEADRMVNSFIAAAALGVSSPWCATNSSWERMIRPGSWRNGSSRRPTSGTTTATRPSAPALT